MAESVKSKIGFTVAELVVVIGLIAIMILFLFGILISNNRFFKNQSGEIRAVNSTREVTDRINQLAREASAIAAAHTYSSVQYTTGSTLAIFQIPAVGSSGDVVSGAFDHVIIGQDPSDASRLFMIVSPDAQSNRRERTLEFSDNLTAIQFSYDDSDLNLAKNITYDITVTEPGSTPAVEQIIGSATIRN